VLMDHKILFGGHKSQTVKKNNKIKTRYSSLENSSTLKNTRFPQYRVPHCFFN